MRLGISGADVDESLPYAKETNQACAAYDFFPMVAYAIFWNESICGQVNGKWNAATVVSEDGGHGIGQLTASFPQNWDDPQTNINYAVESFMVPALHEWIGFQGDDLIRAIAATYNAGYGNAFAGHKEGDIDKYTTDNYASRILATYHNLVNAGKP